MTSSDILERFYDLHPKLIDLSLGRIERLLARLGHPEQKLPPIIHVAGTNGKGSTIAFMRAVLEAHGERVQALTSPHLVRFHERIRLSDGLISEDRLIDVLSRCEEVNAGDPITYFEMTTAAAFLACAEDDADYCLVEVGLGGRFDATNVIESPVATVITPIGYDHQSFLGDTLTEIAHEKGGILKHGIPGFIGLQPPEAMAEVTRVAQQVGAPLTVCDEPVQEGSPGLLGPHQRQNAALALGCLKGIGYPLKPENVAAGLAAVDWPARLQRIESGPLGELLTDDATLWLDGGHNAEAAVAIADAFSGQKLTLIVGLMANKDAEAFLCGISPIVDSVIAVSIPGEASHDPFDLAARAASLGLPSEAAEDISSALRRAPGGDVLICGSLYLAGQVLADSGLNP